MDAQIYKSYCVACLPLRWECLYRLAESGHYNHLIPKFPLHNWQYHSHKGHKEIIALCEFKMYLLLAQSQHIYSLLWSSGFHDWQISWSILPFFCYLQHFSDNPLNKMDLYGIWMLPMMSVSCFCLFFYVLPLLQFLYHWTELKYFLSCRKYFCS